MELFKKQSKRIKSLIGAFVLLLLTFVVISAINSPKKLPDHIFIITMDGARPDILQDANTPNIDLLISKYGASYSFNSKTVCPSLTPPTHASLFTGVVPRIHGYFNSGNNPRVKTIFERFEERGHTTALVDGKGGRIRGLERGVSFFSGGTNHHQYFTQGIPHVDSMVMDLLIDIFDEHRPKLSFVLLPVVDYSGHKFGHESFEYKNAISEADFAIGNLIEYLKENNLWDRSALVIVADHGMTGFHHGNCYPTDMTIPIIKYGSPFEAGEMPPQSITEISIDILNMYQIPFNF